MHAPLLCHGVYAAHCWDVVGEEGRSIGAHTTCVFWEEDAVMELVHSSRPPLVLCGAVVVLQQRGALGWEGSENRGGTWDGAEEVDSSHPRGGKVWWWWPMGDIKKLDKSSVVGGKRVRLDLFNETSSKTLWRGGLKEEVWVYACGRGCTMYKSHPMGFVIAHCCAAELLLLVLLPTCGNSMLSNTFCCTPTSCPSTKYCL